jgi:DNA replication protein DnaC
MRQKMTQMSRQKVVTTPSLGVPRSGMSSESRETTDPQLALIHSYLKQLRLPALARDCVALAREAEQRGAGYLGYLQTLLAQEVTQRHEHQLRRYLKQAQFPYEKRLEDFDFSVVPALPKTRVLELAQGAFLAQHENILLIGPSGLGKTHLLMGLGRAACLRGARVLFRTAPALANELAVAQQQLRLPKLLAQYRRYALILVDEVGYLPFSPTAAELLFQPTFRTPIQRFLEISESATNPGVMRLCSSRSNRIQEHRHLDTSSAIASILRGARENRCSMWQPSFVTSDPMEVAPKPEITWTCRGWRILRKLRILGCGM